MLRTVITGSGTYIPTFIQSNQHFTQQNFFAENQQSFTATSTVLVEKFKQITGIKERRYAPDELNASDIGYLAAKLAIDDSHVNPEDIDQIIVAHNFGNVFKNTIQTDAVPSLASLIKHALGIHNPDCVAYDILFGCPGWVQGLIQADAFFKAGLAKKVLVVGTETLSRVIDIHDRDSMIFSDGAGAAILEYKEVGAEGPGILGACTQTHSLEEVGYINMGKSYYPDSDPSVRFIKMQGRKVYEYALTHVPAAMKACLDKSGVNIHELRKVFIHQANEKMDEAIIKRMYQLYGVQPPQGIMPMCIQWLGNSSVATIPTLYDLVRNNLVDGHFLNTGDVILFASVGAGMNVNAVCYRY